jgi:CheY-like chemotaxis protein
VRHATSGVGARYLRTESALVEKVYCHSRRHGRTVAYRDHYSRSTVNGPAQWSPQLKSFMNKRILVVDDSSAIRGLVRAFIEGRPGLEICGEAADGLEGVEKGIELRPDLIVLDFAMPRMNGLEAATVLHQIVPSALIILFTFYADAISSRLAHDAGVASIISKSDQLSTLADEVQRLTA